MNEFLNKRIDRMLDTLSDERVYQVLDYIEFLESKYAAQDPTRPSPLQRLAETVEDTLRAGRVSASAIKGTMDTMAAAGRVMGGLISPRGAQYLPPWKAVSAPSTVSRSTTFSWSRVIRRSIPDRWTSPPA